MAIRAMPSRYVRIAIERQSLQRWWNLMNDWKREVDYATYCPKCKNFKVLETDEPCNECLTECAREGTVKPVNFKEKTRK